MVATFPPLRRFQVAVLVRVVALEEGLYLVIRPGQPQAPVLQVERGPERVVQAGARATDQQGVGPSRLVEGVLERGQRHERVARRLGRRLQVEAAGRVVLR